MTKTATWKTTRGASIAKPYVSARYAAIATYAAERNVPATTAPPAPKRKPPAMTSSVTTM